MENQEIQKLVKIRTELINEFSRLKDYKSDKNAIMKQIDCATVLHRAINAIDDILKGHVKFGG
jgi:phosphopantothenate synthetase